MSGNIRRNIIRLVLKTDRGSGDCGDASANYLIEKEKYSNTTVGVCGCSIVPFNRCFVDSFDIVVT